MEEIREILEELTKVVKKQNTLLTKIGKALYLIPASDKELKQIESNIRNNTQKYYENVNELNKLLPIENDQQFDLFLVKNNYETDYDVYCDVVGDDFLKGGD